MARVIIFSILVSLGIGATMLWAEPTPNYPGIVGEKVKSPPKLVVKRERIVPAARPDYDQLEWITSYESAKWGVSEETLERVIFCESRFDPDAQNGVYGGLAQFHPDTFARGLSTIGDRSVRYVEVEKKKRPELITTYYENGAKEVTKGPQKTVKVKTIHHGEIPLTSDYKHGHAQVRVLAQAQAGISAVGASEWECN